MGLDMGVRGNGEYQPMQARPCGRLSPPRHGGAHVRVHMHVHAHVQGVLGGFVTASSSSFSPMGAALACGS